MARGRLRADLRKAVAPTETWKLEDFEIGDITRTMMRTVTETDLVSFVALSGFYEELWINTRKAKADTLERSRLVPGYLTLIIAEGLYILTGRMHNAMALLSIDEIHWPAPVTCGDGIYCLIEIEQARRSNTRKDRGIVQTLHRVLNHDDVEVLRYRSARMIRARNLG